MDWTGAIERHSAALKVILAALVVMLGLPGSGAAARISQGLHRAVRRLLQPAESATRRLIVIAAQGLEVKLPPPRLAKTKVIGAKAIGNDRKPRSPLFRLYDPRKRLPFSRRARFRPRAYFFPPEPVTYFRPWPPAEAQPAPPRRPMASSTPRRSAAGSRRSRSRSKTFRARRNASPSAAPGARGRKPRASNRRSGPACCRATGRNSFVISITFLSNATASPGTRWATTHPDPPIPRRLKSPA